MWSWRVPPGVERDADGGASGEAAWLFFRSAEVPPRWRDRAIAFSLVPLAADEVASLVRDEPARPPHALAPTDLALAQLVARGAGRKEIAVELGVSSRTVDRRLAALRQRHGATTPAELVARLAQAGFGLARE